jgi:spore coat protein CotH
MEPKQQGGPQFRGRRGSFLQGPEGGRNGIAAAFGLVFDYVRADLEFGPYKFKDVGVRYKGNGTFLSSRESLKRPLKIDLNQFVKGQKLGGMSQLNLHNSVRDPSGMNEAIAYRLFRDGGVPAPRTAYARVYVTVPGIHDRRYFGLYNLVEDVGSAFAQEWFTVKQGAIFKPVAPDLFSDLGDDWKCYNQTYGSSLDRARRQRLWRPGRQRRQGLSTRPG